MATFLVTPRMHPALRARVERAVSHRARARHNAAKLRLDRTFGGGGRLRIARLFPIVTAAILAIVGTLLYVQDRRAVEAERLAILGALEERRASLPRGHEGFLAQTERWIAETASDVDTEVVDPALRSRGALDAWLSRPAVYVRAPAAELRDAKKVGDATQGSNKDAFLLCLLQPPAAAGERDLLAKVRGVYFAGAKVDDATANVRRLEEARRGLAVLGSAFEGWVRAADNQKPLAKLRRDLEGAPIEQARKAIGAELLIVVADAAGGAPDKPQEARVALVDLTSKKVLLRARRRPEEQGRSPLAMLHRADLEGCSLALAVRRAVEE